MRSVRARLHPVAEGDRGMTLIEVMVAMFVFAIISTLVLSSLVQIITVNRNSQSQHVAANLAAAEIELAQNASDVFDVLNDSWTVSVDGTDFHIVRVTEWVSASAEEVACGMDDDSDSLRFKRVNITVTWEGMRPSAAPVRADSIINPNSRINDPTKGTVMASIFDSIGEPVAGATVRLTATSEGAAVDSVTTDGQGCAYLLRVTPGLYEVSVQKADYFGVFEETPRQQDVSVQAGVVTSVGLQYDLAARLNATLADGSSARLPNGGPSLTLLRTGGIRTVSFTNNAAVQTVRMHPRVGYRVFAGTYRNERGETCEAVDPAAWPEALVDGVLLGAGTSPEVSAPPGGTIAVGIPMGLVQISNRTTNLRVTVAPGRVGDPGCGTAVTYEFGTVSRDQIIALPYGSWLLRSGSNNVAATVVGGSAAVNGVVTLDPRPVAP